MTSTLTFVMRAGFKTGKPGRSDMISGDDLRRIEVLEENRLLSQLVMILDI